MKTKTLLLLTLLTGVTLFSCEKDDDVNNSTTNNVEESQKDDILTDIKSHVTVSSTYKNFHFYIYVKTSLQDLYPGKKIRYGIEVGYNDGSSSKEYPYYQYADNNKYYSINSNKTQFEFIAGIFFGNYTTEELYARSYLALMEKQKNESLRSDEKDLLKDITPKLKSAESEVLPKLNMRFFVEIDGNRYYPQNIK